MKVHRHYGQYIHKEIVLLKKNHSDWNYRELVWDQLDNDYNIHIKISLKKKRLKLGPTDSGGEK